jgi:hypothetical protein
MKHALLVACALLCLLFVTATNARAQIQKIAPAAPEKIEIRNGESFVVERLYAEFQCKNDLKGPPTIEVLVGPPQLALSLKEAMVPPHNSPACTQELPGYILSLKADGVTATTTTPVVVRWRHDMQHRAVTRARFYEVTLIP